MSHLSFTAYGEPRPQGSVKAYVVNGRARITSANAAMKPWRETIKAAAIEASTEKILGPVAAYIVFYVKRPKSTPKKIMHPAKKPDLDKLVRCVFDALTEASVWQDDAQVVEVSARKVYSDEDHRMGVDVTIVEKGA